MKIVKSSMKVMLTHREVMDALAYWLRVVKQQNVSLVSFESIHDPSDYSLDSSYTDGIVLEVFENE